MSHDHYAVATSADPMVATGEIDPPDVAVDIDDQPVKMINSTPVNSTTAEMGALRRGTSTEISVSTSLPPSVEWAPGTPIDEVDPDETAEPVYTPDPATDRNSDHPELQLVGVPAHDDHDDHDGHDAAG